MTLQIPPPPLPPKYKIQANVNDMALQFSTLNDYNEKHNRIYLTIKYKTNLTDNSKLNKAHDTYLQTCKQATTAPTTHKP